MVMVASQNGRGGFAVISEELYCDKTDSRRDRVSAYLIFCGKGTTTLAVAVS